MSKVIIARNAAALIVSDVGIRFFTAIGVVLIARSLGPRAYGILSIALAFSGIVAYLSDLGLTHLTLQHATKPDANIGRILGTIFRVRLVLVVGTVLASLVTIVALYPEPEERSVMLAVVLPSIFGVAMQGFAGSYFWAMQELHVTAGLKAAGGVLSAVALVLAFLFGWRVRCVAAIYGATSFVGGVACLWLVRRRAPKMSGWEPGILKGLTAFTVSGITGIALPQLGPLIMDRVTTATEVGYFAAASRIPSLLYAIPGALGMAWYPQLFQAGARDHAQHFALSVEQLKLNVIVSVGLSLPVAFHARLLVRAILGASWELQAAPVLSLLSWMVVLNSISTPFADALTTKGLQARRAFVYVGALVVGAILFSVLASAGGAIGAAKSAIVTQTLLSLGLIMVNPSGRRLLVAGGRNCLRPICLGSASVLVVYGALADTIVAAVLSIALYFFVAIVVDLELRTVVRRAADMIYTRWRYA